MMGRTALQLAGWIAAISAILTVPLFAFQAMAARAGPTLFSSAIQLFNALLLLYVLASLRTLLAQKQLTSANPALAGILAVSVLLQFGALAPGAGNPALATLLLCGLVALGALYFVTGIKLLAVAGQLPGLKLFCYAAMAVGVCSASVILALLALPASMVMDVALAIIFFREAAAMPAAAPGSH